MVRIAFLLGAALAALSGAVFAAPPEGASLGDADAIPHLGAKGRAGYAAFLQSAPHRAFVIAPGGAWAWRGDLISPEDAETEARRECESFTEQTCVPYALDDQVVFDAAAWPRLWGPYPAAAAAARTPVGTDRGDRFPDLAFADPDGRPATLADFRGRVVVLHFWGAWCPPCQYEMPELAALHDAVARAADLAPRVDFVLLQVREPVARSRRWMKRRGHDLPVYDSGATGAPGEGLRLAAGGTLDERALAPVFPSTYVLDRHGVVAFASRGPLTRWIEYLPFLRDAADRSGR